MRILSGGAQTKAMIVSNVTLKVWFFDTFKVDNIDLCLI